MREQCAVARIRLFAKAVVFAALALIVLAGCRPEATEPDVDPLTLNEISGERLWQRVTEEAPYQTYRYWPDEVGVQPGQAPHGPFHRIFVNKTLYDAVPIASAIAPDGSIIVKENLDTSRRLTGYTVIAKVSGYDPEHSDWYWARYMPDGSVMAAGTLTSCINCHAGMKANDYLIVQPLDQPLADGQ